MSAFRGMTFIEMLVVISVTAFIMSAIVLSLFSFYRANTSSIEQGFQIESARRGVDLLVREIREAENGDEGSHPVYAISTSSVTFFSDTDRDDSIELIEYSLSGNMLTRRVVDSSGVPPLYGGAGTTTIVSQYVRNEEEGVSLFRYFDEEGAEITDLSLIGAVRVVEIRLVVNVLPIRAPAEFVLNSSATIRNLRDN